MQSTPRPASPPVSGRSVRPTPPGRSPAGDAAVAPWPVSGEGAATAAREARVARIDPARVALWAFVLLFCTSSWAAVMTVVESAGDRGDAPPLVEQAPCAAQASQARCSCPQPAAGGMPAEPTSRSPSRPSGPEQAQVVSR